MPRYTRAQLLETMYPRAHRLDWLDAEVNSPLNARLAWAVPIIHRIPPLRLEKALVLALIKQESDVKRWSGALNEGCCHGVAQINLSTGPVDLNPFNPSEAIPWAYRKINRLFTGDLRRAISQYNTGPNTATMNDAYVDAVLSKLDWARRVLQQGGPVVAPQPLVPPSVAGTFMDGLVWAPDPATIEAGISAARGLPRASHPFAVIRVGEQTQLAPCAAVTELMREVARRFGLRNAGTRRSPPKVKAPGATRDPHEEGIACDVWARGTAGAVAANFLVHHAVELDLQLVLFSNKLWAANAARPWQAQGGKTATGRHEDHLHLEVGATARTWRPGEMARRIGAIR